MTTKIQKLVIQLLKVLKLKQQFLKNTKNKTILVFKKRRRKNSRKKYGHRQPISLIKITKIFSKDGKLIAKAELKKEKTPIKAEKPKKEKTPAKIAKPKVGANKRDESRRNEKNTTGRSKKIR